MADVTDFTTWSSTASSNQPTGTTSIGTGLDDNLRAIQAEVAKWRDGTGYGVLTLTGVAGSNSITGSTSPAPTLAANQKYLLVPAGTNTGAVVLNVNSAGNKNVYAGNSALVGGELHANIPVLIEYDGTQFQVLGPVFKQPTFQAFTTGSGTYTTPTGATRIRVRLVGGGGSGATSGSDGGDTTFSTLTGRAGKGASAQGGSGGAGGAATGGDINISGGSGASANQGSIANVLFAGVLGGASVFGGPGAPGAPSAAGSDSSAYGSGGSSDGTGSATNGRPAGGAGGYCEKVFTAPAATYSYGVGAGGAAGTGGCKGGGGYIIVEEFYN